MPPPGPSGNHRYTCHKLLDLRASFITWGNPSRPCACCTRRGCDTCKEFPGPTAQATVNCNLSTSIVSQNRYPSSQIRPPKLILWYPLVLVYDCCHKQRTNLHVDSVCSQYSSIKRLQGSLLGHVYTAAAVRVPPWPLGGRELDTDDAPVELSPGWGVLTLTMPVSLRHIPPLIPGAVGGEYPWCVERREPHALIAERGRENAWIVAFASLSQARGTVNIGVP